MSISIQNIPAYYRPQVNAAAQRKQDFITYLDNHIVFCKGVGVAHNTALRCIRESGVTNPQHPRNFQTANFRIGQANCMENIVRFVRDLRNCSLAVRVLLCLLMPLWIELAIIATFPMFLPISYRIVTEWRRQNAEDTAKRELAPFDRQIQAKITLLTQISQMSPVEYELWKAAEKAGASGIAVVEASRQFAHGQLRSA